MRRKMKEARKEKKNLEKRIADQRALSATGFVDYGERKARTRPVSSKPSRPQSTLVSRPPSRNHSQLHMQIKEYIPDINMEKLTDLYNGVDELRETSKENLTESEINIQSSKSSKARPVKKPLTKQLTFNDAGEVVETFSSTDSGQESLNRIESVSNSS